MSGSASQKLSFQAMVFVACLFPFYILAATLTNSAAVLTDLLATSFDLTSLTTCWLVLRIAHGREKGRFAYGLGKLENLAELMIAVLQVVLVVIAGTRAIHGLLNPEHVSGALLGLGVTAVAAVGNVYLNRKARRVAEETHSPVIAAQARVHLVSAVSSGSVFVVTVITSSFSVDWIAYLDPLASFVVIALMIYNIFEMLTNSIGSLLDQAIGEAGQLRILRALASHFDDFEELGDIRTRQHGGKMMVDLHLGFDADWSVGQARAAAAAIRAAVVREFAEAGDDVEVSIVLIPRAAEPADAPVAA
ncbi:cation diffusion facilitator family transporter [Azorhizobium doebereinerae]|uniref:cation diffusion facilitator family transporter n=1 Tax=Azorhizobium doebereinerae TaxID=281091 RepID=UPI00042895CB|nr:cation diffusion facilitator family transporter [Azorhizobium doebereinerae]